jgi:hypothetical protein
MSTRNKIRITVVVLAVLVAALTYYTLREPCRYDPAKVSADLQGLQEPYRKVSIDYYVSEGGAIGIAVTDAKGTEKKFLLPKSASGQYDQILAGVQYVKEAGGVPVPNPDQSRRMLTDIVARHGDGGPDADMALLALRGHPVDRLRVWIRRQTQ